MTHEELLSKFPVFESLTSEELKKLAEHAEHQVVQLREIIFRQGDAESNSLYLVEEGAIEISKGERKSRVMLANFTRGQYFGELSHF